MSVIIKDGNILDSGADIICHQVNCMGAMNSGVAKAIRQKWPVVYTEYLNAHTIVSGDINESHTWMHMHGHIQPVYIGEENGKDRAVINMFAQRGFGYDGARYTSYDAFWNCLWEIKQYIEPGKRIAFPYKIGCVRGGANWNIIYMMIVEVLGEDYNVELWRYDNG